MSAKNITARGVAHRQRKMVNAYMFKELMAKKYEAEIPPMNTKEQICSKCGFKARYKFLRCPHCDEVQK